MRVVHKVTEAKKKLTIADVKQGQMFSTWSTKYGEVRYFMKTQIAFDVEGATLSCVDIQDGRVCEMPASKEVYQIFPNAFVTLGKDSE